MGKTKKETIEEFLARGGKVETVPYKEPEDESDPVRSTTTTGLPEIMTLSDGAHFFGETRKKKKTQKDFIDKVKNSNLPQSVIDSLTSKTKGRHDI